MTPHKVYGIARHDVMMSQECEVPEVNQGLHHQCVPATNGGSVIKRETAGRDQGVPNLFHICKKVGELTPQVVGHHWSIEVLQTLCVCVCVQAGWTVRVMNC